MKRVMRCHDFGSGREARRSQYREYWQGERQSHGPKFVPARRVAATIGGAPKRGAGIGATWSRDPFTGCDRGTDHRRVAPMPILCASPGSDPKGPLFRPATRPLAGMRPRRRARVLRMMARYRPAAGSHPTVKPLEPAPPYAGHFVGRLVHIRDMNCAPPSRHPQFWLATHTCFIMLRTLNQCPAPRSRHPSGSWVILCAWEKWHLRPVKLPRAPKQSALHRSSDFSYGHAVKLKVA
jgi:hypothetical protein